LPTKLLPTKADYNGLHILIIGASALLIGALGFQYIGGLPPCPLCMTQRWWLVASIVAAILALPPVEALRPARTTLFLIAVACVWINAGYGAYHAGIEWGWWQGPTTCTGAPGSNANSLEDLAEALKNAPVVRCDEVQFRFLWLSLAGWNATISAALGLAALLRGRR